MQRFVSAYHTDVGIKKKVNQDAICLEVADAGHGEIGFAAVCDGMGGLSDGEKASAILTKDLAGWFENRLGSLMLVDGRLPSFDTFKEEMDLLINVTNEKIQEQVAGESGTTASVLLLAAGKYYIANVGDSRVYQMTGRELCQLTKDQTVAQRDVDRGLITPEQVAKHAQRNVLLQCVGASDIVVVDYFEGSYQSGDTFLICSDGFRHKVKANELEEALRVESVAENTDENYHTILEALVELNKKRGERDNISAVVLKAVDA